MFLKITIIFTIYLFLSSCFRPGDTGRLGDVNMPLREREAEKEEAPKAPMIDWRISGEPEWVCR